jgi:diaminopropionate ammonia-lyase
LGQKVGLISEFACGKPNPIAWEILRDRADYFAICPDFVAAMGRRVYGVLLRGDPAIISGESGAVTLGVLMYIMQQAWAELARTLDQLGRKYFAGRVSLCCVGR